MWPADAPLVSTAAPRVSSERLLVLDALRFLAALVVAISHLGVPFFSPLKGQVPSLPQQLVLFFFNGPAAVMVFFLLSGFCIHLPFVGERPPALRAFYTRRVLRLVLPLLAWLPLAWVLPERTLSLAALWSLWAELLYYLCYPALRRALARVGWAVLYGGSVTLAAAILLFHPVREGIPGYGPGLAWLLGLPVWLLGVRLAERWQAQRLQPMSHGGLWGLRVALALAGWVASVLHWKRVPDGVLLNLYAWLAAAWLGQELLCAQGRTLPSKLVAAGGWSYSLYLTHIGVGMAILTWLPLPAPLASACALLVALAVAWLFGRGIEAPAHRLARRLGTVE